MLAAKNGRADTVIHLLGRPDHIDVNAQSATGIRALDIACRSGHLEVVKLLVGAGARIDYQPYYETGPLAAAAFGGHLHVLRYLVEEAGADERRADLGGWTPLLWAINSGRMKIMAYLLGRLGIDMDAETAEGKRALEMVCTCGRLEVVKMCIAAYLVDRPGIDIDVTTATGHTALSIACDIGRLEVVKLLVEAGVRVESQSSGAMGALASAAAKGHLHVVKYLVEEAGADVQPALASAAAKGHLHVVEYLVEEAGADVQPAGPKRMTPLMVADYNYCYNVKRYLEEVILQRKKEVML
jgi:ankyrin repeat protein